MMDKCDTSEIHCPSELYAEIVEIVTACGLACEETGVFNSQWGWNAATALSIRQINEHVDVEFEDWVIEKLLYEEGARYACRTISYIDPGEFGLLCAQIVFGLPKDNSDDAHAGLSPPNGNC